MNTKHKKKRRKRRRKTAKTLSSMLNTNRAILAVTLAAWLIPSPLAK